MSVATGESMETIEGRYDGQGYGAFKADVAEAVIALLEPVRLRYDELRLTRATPAAPGPWCGEGACRVPSDPRDDGRQDGLRRTAFRLANPRVERATGPGGGILERQPAHGHALPGGPPGRPPETGDPAHERRRGG